MICLENNNNMHMMKILPVLPTRQFSTLTTIFGHLEGVGSHKNTRYEQACVYRNLCVYITRDFSSALAFQMYGRSFFSVPDTKFMLYFMDGPMV